MLKVGISFIFMLSSLISSWGLSVHSISYDSVHYETFRDTVFDKSLPPVELEFLTYSNFNITTVGYSFTLRNAELEIRDVLLYVGNPQKKCHTIKPFTLHIGDVTEHNRIDRVLVWNKFPFEALYPSSDSLVIFTDRGNFTIYMDESRRLQQALDEERSIFNRQIEDSENRYHNLYLLIFGLLAVVIVIVVIAVVIHYVLKKKREDTMSKLVVLLSENEAKNRTLNDKVFNLFKHNFETLNKLCYEYYEKADTQSLRKSIYHEVENEILKFREPAEISNLEQSLNEYCDNIMQKVDAQLPNLTDSDRVLLIYLFSGLSARTISMLNDIEIKTFYMRRYRLKNKIQSSDAPDKDLFIEHI